MYILYKNDSTIAGLNQSNIDAVVSDMKKENLALTVEGTLEDFLGVNINRRKYGSTHLSQPHLIEQIVKYFGRDNPKTPSNSTPAHTFKIFHYHKQSYSFDKIFHNISVVGKLSYLEKCCRTNIYHTTHQCASF